MVDGEYHTGKPQKGVNWYTTADHTAAPVIRYANPVCSGLCQRCFKAEDF